MSKAIQIALIGDQIYALTDAGRIYRSDFAGRFGWQDITGPWAEVMPELEPSFGTLDLDVRSYNCLNRGTRDQPGINPTDPARKILAIEHADYIKNFGRRSFECVVDALRKVGIPEQQITASAFYLGVPPSWRQNGTRT